jgi:dolichol kinase
MVKVKIVERLDDARKIINSIEYDPHWYRRVFHTFSASFILYYMLPDLLWISYLKIWIPVALMIFIFVLEYMRINRKVNSNHFFGLRMYEKDRISSYLFFGIAVFILLLFFPQQIAIPCILCASIADPIMGEVRQRFGQKKVYLVGFLICMIFFLVTWYKADFWFMLFISVIGASCAVIGETKKIKWLDDDFMIQMTPAILLLIIWFLAGSLGLVLPDPVIHPGVLPW